ncbi:MAG: tetratricopeptide repeat protein [Bryobacteraceae bacterium]|jgi:tetratricopeptide (TPR) repeat protein
MKPAARIAVSPRRRVTVSVPARPPASWPIYASILAAVMAVYWPALRGGLLWDDTAHITAPVLQSLHGLWRIWFSLGATQQYYPLLHSAFWIEHRLWGDAVLGYHLANLAQHALGACLVVAIVRRLKLPGAWLAGMVFALHPVCVEAVAWISEQKSTLSAVFYLSSAYIYLGFDRTRRRSSYLWALALFILALLTKTVTATLPAALLVIFWWQRGRLDWRRDIRPLVPWIGLGAAAGLFTAWVERTLIGAQGAAYALTITQRFLLAGRAIWFYAAKLLWPANLIFSYPRWKLDPAVPWQYVYPMGVIAVVIGLCLLARRHRGPLAAMLLFAGTLFPALGFFNIYPFLFSYVADHFQYLASLALIVPLSYALVSFVTRLGRPADVVLPAVLLAILATLSWRQAGTYRDTETLYRATLLRNPASWLAHNNLGVALLEKPGHLAEARTEYQAVLALKPDDAEAHNNLGNALARMPGRLPEAIREFEIAIKLEPRLAQAHQNLGNALARNPQRIADSIAQFKIALQLKPDDPQIRNNLGVTMLESPGHISDAITQFQDALKVSPRDAQIRTNLGNALSQVPERRPEAIAQFQAILRSEPNNPQAHNSLAITLAQMPGRLPDAIAEFQAALRADPRFAEAHNNLGRALSRLPGRMPEAIAEYRAALQIKPDYAQARANLEAACAQNSQYCKQP